MGPEKVASPAKDMIMAQPENTDFYKIVNMYDEYDNCFNDYWILTKNLTPEEKK